MNIKKKRLNLRIQKMHTKEKDKQTCSHESLPDMRIEPTTLCPTSEALITAPSSQSTQNISDSRLSLELN